jgi:hypothetical protein
MPSPTQSEVTVDSLPSRFDIPAEPALTHDRYLNRRHSFGTRALLALVRFLIVFCIGISATLAWQSYGDAAREMIASSYPQLSWLTPQAEPVAQKAPDVTGLASPTASSADQQQPNALLLDFERVRQSIDRLATSIATSQGQMASSADRIAATQGQIASSVERMATSQEQIARSVDQLTADQEQMAREVAKLQRIEQSLRSKNPEPSPRPALGSAPKPLARPAPATAPTAKPASRASPEPTDP